MATVSKTRRGTRYDVEVRKGSRLIRIIGLLERSSTAIRIRDLFNELQLNPKSGRAVIRKRHRGMGGGRYQVVALEWPEGWKPSDWSDVPPVPYRVVGIDEKSCTRAQAEGRCFGNNTSDDAEYWLIAVRIHATRMDVAHDDEAGHVANVSEVSQMVLVRTVNPDGSEQGERRLLCPTAAAAYVEMYNDSRHAIGGRVAEAKPVALPWLTGKWDSIDAAPMAKGGAA